MRAIRFAAAAACMLALAACQGNYSSGPQVPSTIPPAAVSVASAAPSGAAGKTAARVAPSGAQSFALTDAARGFACAPSAGFGCLLRFNLPPEAPSPKPSASAPATASPRPTAAPSGSSSPLPSPSASPAGATIVLSSTVLPADAPKMVNTSKNAAPTTALMRIDLIASADFLIEGRGIAEFSLPKEQLADRGFAVQVFEELVHHKRHDLHAVMTLPKSQLAGQTLSFRFSAPKMTLPKGRRYVVILYGDQRNPATATPPAATPPATASPVPTTRP